MKKKSSGLENNSNKPSDVEGAKAWLKQNPKVTALELSRWVFHSLESGNPAVALLLLETDALKNLPKKQDNASLKLAFRKSIEKDYQDIVKVFTNFGIKLTDFDFGLRYAIRAQDEELSDYFYPKTLSESDKFTYIKYAADLKKIKILKHLYNKKSQANEGAKDNKVAATKTFVMELLVRNNDIETLKSVFEKEEAGKGGKDFSEANYLLHYATKQGFINEKVITFLCDKKGKNINYKDQNNKTPMDYAIERSDYELIKILLPFIEIYDLKNYLPKLNLVAKEIVSEYLLLKGEALKTPLYEASESGNVKDIAVILGAMQVGYVDPTIHSKAITKTGDLNNKYKEQTQITDLGTPLYAAIKNGHFEAVKFLIERKAFKMGDCDFEKAFRDMSAQNRTEDMIKFLFENNIVSKKAVFDTTPNLVEKQLLGEEMLRENPELKITIPLISLIVSERTDEALEVVRKANITIWPGSIDNSPLMKSLKEVEFTPWGELKTGCTLVMQAIISSYKGKDLDQKNIETCIAFLKGVFSSSEKLSGYGFSIVEILLDNENYISLLKDKKIADILTVFIDAQLSSEFSNTSNDTLAKILELYKTKGLSIDIQDKDGRTHLHKAAEKGEGSIVEQLIKYGANKDLPTKSGELAIDMMPFGKNSSAGSLLKIIKALDGENVNYSQLLSKAVYSSCQGTEKIVKFLIEEKRVDVKNSLNIVRIFSTIYNINKEVLEVLRPYLKDDEANKILSEKYNSYAIREEYFYIAAILVSDKTPQDLKDKLLSTALWDTDSYKAQELALHTLKHGAKAKINNSQIQHLLNGSYSKLLEALYKQDKENVAKAIKGYEYKSDDYKILDPKKHILHIVSVAQDHKNVTMLKILAACGIDIFSDISSSDTANYSYYDTQTMRSYNTVRYWYDKDFVCGAARDNILEILTFMVKHGTKFCSSAIPHGYFKKMQIQGLDKWKQDMSSDLGKFSELKKIIENPQGNNSYHPTGESLEIAKAMYILSSRKGTSFDKLPAPVLKTLMAYTLLTDEVTPPPEDNQYILNNIVGKAPDMFE